MSCKDFKYQESLNTTNSTIFDKWILYKLDSVVSDFKKYTTTYRFDLMANSIYDFVWNEYCDWYLEFAKNNMNETTKNHLIFSIIRIIKLCHPIIPFITEDIWKELYSMKFVSEPMLINSSFPSQIRISKEYDIASRVESIKSVIKRIRKTRAELGIHPREIIDVKIKIKKTSFGQDVEQYSNQINIISNVNVDVIQHNEESTEYIDLIDENYILFLKIRHMINVKEEVIKINKKIQDLATIIDKIDGKLNNKDFIERAPSEIINQNISNKTKLENDISSLKSLRQTLSD